MVRNGSMLFVDNFLRGQQAGNCSSATVRAKMTMCLQAALDVSLFFFKFFFRIAMSEKRFILHMQYGKRFAYVLSLQFQLSWITLGAVFFLPL